MLDVLREFSEDLLFNPTGRPLTAEELKELLADCDGYIAGLDFVTEEALENCPKLKVISRYGAGVDRVDLEAARARGIKVTNTPGVNAEAVGELAFGLVLAAARKIPYLDRKNQRRGMGALFRHGDGGKDHGHPGTGSHRKSSSQMRKGLWHEGDGL